MNLQQIKQIKKQLYAEDKFLKKNYGKVVEIPAHTREIIREGARQETMGVLCCVMATVLNSDYGFGAKRIDNVCEQMLKQLEAVKLGNLDPTEILDVCKKIGMDFKKFGYILEE